MNPRITTATRLTASFVAALLVATSVVTPVLDAGRAVHSVVLESEHHATSCLSGHDHTICTQVGANLALAPDDALSSMPATERGAAVTASARTPTSVAPEWNVRPRAPPLART